MNECSFKVFGSSFPPSKSLNSVRFQMLIMLHKNQGRIWCLKINVAFDVTVGWRIALSLSTNKVLSSTTALSRIYLTTVNILGRIVSKTVSNYLLIKDEDMATNHPVCPSIFAICVFL